MIELSSVRLPRDLVKDLGKGKKKRPRPTLELLHEVFDYYPFAGEVRWKVNRHNGAKAGELCNSTITVDGRTHFKVNFEGQTLMLSHVAWALSKGRWPKRLRYRDDNPANLALANLMEAES